MGKEVFVKVSMMCIILATGVKDYTQAGLKNGEFYAPFRGKHY